MAAGITSRWLLDADGVTTVTGTLSPSSVTTEDSVIGGVGTGQRGGAGKTIAFGDVTDWDGLGQHSIALWLYIHDLRAGNQCPFVYKNDVRLIATDWETAGKLTVGVHSGTNNNVRRSQDVVLAINTLYHIVHVFNGTADANYPHTVYINGSAITTVNVAVAPVATLGNNAVSLQLLYDEYNRYADATLFDVRTYNGAWSAGDVTELYSAGFGAGAELPVWTPRVTMVL